MEQRDGSQHHGGVATFTQYGHHFRSQRSESPRQRTALPRRAEDWTTWPELTIKLSGLPRTTTTFHIYEMVKDEGEIVKIDLPEDHKGHRLGDAYVSFSPPPRRDFWNAAEEWALQDMESGTRHRLTMQLRPKQRAASHPSSAKPDKSYSEHMELYLARIEFGFMYQPSQMMVMHSIASTYKGSIKLWLNLQRREMVIEFPIKLSSSRNHLQGATNKLIKFVVPFHQMDTFWESHRSASQTAVIFKLENPPAFYQKSGDIYSTFDDSKHWDERYRWSRVTEIKRHNNSGTGNAETTKFSALSLRSFHELIDIGRWTTYRIFFDTRGCRPFYYESMKEVLTEYNVKFRSDDQMEAVTRIEESVWDWIDRPKDQPFTSFLEEMSSGFIDLKWPLRYQLESCISLGVLNERNICKEFILQLNSLADEEAVLRLEVAADGNKRFFNPFDIFRIPIPHSLLSRRIPNYCVSQRSVTVTPTTIYYSTPNVEMSNRVLRLFHEHADRFLRVRFSGEKYEGRIHPTDEITQDAVFTRIYDCLTSGLTIGDRHFEFVATGNSQFREHGAYFFASTPSLSASDIRSQLGQIGKFQNGEFHAEKIVAKYTSRLGQCFSTTRPIRGTTIQVIEISDVERNGHTFTDGVGVISPFLVKLIALELQIQNKPDELPSAFQFRMGGIKGIAAVSSRAKNNEMHVRPSQYKFPALYEGLEIIRWSYYSVARLNRQLIVVLRALGIPGVVFIRKLEIELQLLEEAMTDEAIAQSILRKHVDYNRETLTLANIIADGFMENRDPFCMSALHLWRAWRTKQLREKAALTIDQGAFLLGCTDETKTLRGYTENGMPAQSSSLQAKIDALPQIFVQISDPDKSGGFRVITGLCIVARNPSLHPGDIRVVEAVDIPGLHHLRDVVVFPQTGDRDIPSMCSGGDLDGDDFIVIWDPTLIPGEQDWDQPAMDFTPPPPKMKRNGVIDIKDIVSFFVTYMRTDTLRTIATSHLANADFYANAPIHSRGVQHPKCLELAKYHSIAVDYPKSGVPAPPIKKLRPFKYPHFMPNSSRPKSKYYHSTTVLGKMYDAVPATDFQPKIHLPFDNRILEAFQLEPDLLNKAALVKKEYDTAMRRIMAQHKIETEFEVWTTFVMQHAHNTNDYKFGEELGRISCSLKDQFVEICKEYAGGKDFETLAPFVAAMYTVTANEVNTALQKANEQAGMEMEDTPLVINSQNMPLMSFPWLFHRELGKIARGPRAVRVHETSALAEGHASKRHNPPFDLTDIKESVGEIVNDGKATGRGDLLQLFQNDRESEVKVEERRAITTADTTMEDVFKNPHVTVSISEKPDEAMEEGEVEDEVCLPRMTAIS